MADALSKRNSDIFKELFSSLLIQAQKTIFVLSTFRGIFNKDMEPIVYRAFQKLTPQLEERIQNNPLLNIDTFIIPSPYIKDHEITKDYDHSYALIEEGEILGYMEVYSDAEKKFFHIYKLVTSPFGRGKGIGTSFIEHLANNISSDASVYLYIWEKQIDTVEFFKNKGFNVGDTTVYRNMVYYHLQASKREIKKKTDPNGQVREFASEEIGKTRHDARKTVRLLSHMVEKLAPENLGRIIEDINRETTTLVNMLNTFRDSMETLHEVNLKDVIVERIIPFIEASPVKCEFRLNLATKQPIILGYFVNIGRAMVNLVSNSLEAIEEAQREGLIEIEIREDESYLYLEVEDNGTGIEESLLNRDEEGYPRFVGKTTKQRKHGEGLGTVQIFSTFGPENIEISSVIGEGTTWQVRFNKRQAGLDAGFVRLQRRYNEFRTLIEQYEIDGNSDRNTIIASIWQLRKMEIFLFDLIMQFNKYHNMRNIYRGILSFLMGFVSEEEHARNIDAYQCDHMQMKEWLLNISLDIRRRMQRLETVVNPIEYKGALFKSYGQAIENIMIFTLDPGNGNSLCTDRKLAEHLDFVQYLEKDREELLRGEFVGDMNNVDQPIYLGVWTIKSARDLEKKLKMMREGAKRLLEIGIKKKKKLAFYQTTYPHHSHDINDDMSSTFGEFSELSDQELWNFARIVDEEDEMGGMLVYRD